MTCKDVQYFVLMDLYQEISAADQEQLRSHLNQCSNCRKYAEENQQLFNLLSQEEIEEINPRWDECWHKIEERMAIEENKGWSWLPVPSWSMALAASVILLVVGFWLGRNFLPSPSSAPSLITQISSQGRQAMVSNYLEDLKPIMVDLANYSTPAAGQNGGPVEKEIINNMLTQTRLLRQYFRSRNDANINMWLEEMEVILIDLNNIESGDRRSLQSLQGIIKEKGIPLKIKMLQQKTNRMQTI